MRDMLYEAIKPLLFRLDPELSHGLMFKLLSCMPYKLLKHLYKPLVNPKEIVGLRFPNAVGLAAGLDKNAEYIEALFALGFGFVEIGTVTPRPQLGNPRPRLFRIPEKNAVINRMGFNNHGVEAVKKRLQKLRDGGILGVNIGKNKDTPLERAKEDYVYVLKELALFADYITLNLSSPNTPDLRKLQFGEQLEDLIKAVQEEQKQQQRLLKKPLPLFIKIAPDMEIPALEAVITVLIRYGVEGVIATNTTVEKTAVQAYPHGTEEGGLSGQPLYERSTEIVRLIRTIDHRRQLAIMGVGGIGSLEQARDKLLSGADALQLYTGLIYKGPSLIKEVGQAFEQ